MWSIEDILQPTPFRTSRGAPRNPSTLRAEWQLDSRKLTDKTAPFAIYSGAMGLVYEEIDPWQPWHNHERVVLLRDDDTGVEVVIALHSTVLGPALGGTRMNAFAQHSSPRAAAYADALRLSHAMTLKNALAGLPHGGGKGVIICDPKNATPQILRAYGRFVAQLGGDYVTAGDVGVSVNDMDVIGEVCSWTTGRSPEHGGVGDSGILTAVGVWQGMRAAADFTWGRAELAGRRVLVIGAGKVGGRLIDHLLAEGAEVAFVDPSTSESIRANHPQARPLTSLDEALTEEWDIVSPNALGGLITGRLASSIQTKVVCGGANNQVGEAGADEVLRQRGITYTPDFMVNCGGVIQVAEEFRATTAGTAPDLDRARVQTMRVFETTRGVLEGARSAGVTPLAAAQAQAQALVAAAAAAR